MIKYVKYEDLSAEIKGEIEKFKNENAISYEEALESWFKHEFDNWLITSYKKSDTKRKHYRLDVEIPIKIVDTLIETATDDIEAKAYIGKVVNISKGGLYFKYDKPIELSSIIKVVIDLSEIDQQLKDVEALAMIVRADKMDTDYGIGVLFSSIQGEHKESLEIFILKKLAFHMYPGAE